MIFRKFKKDYLYDFKTKSKKLLRGIFYLKITQFIICYLIYLYIWFVYITSKRNFKFPQNINSQISKKRPIIFAFWHNRLIMSPFYARRICKNLDKNKNFITLSSKHGDGRFVGEVMNLFGFENIYGSSQDKRKSSRGIDLKNLRKLITKLKAGNPIGITPDGPRGPNQKINGQIIDLAKLSNAVIIPLSCAVSNFIEINSWDKFKIPLPFSKINFFSDEIIEIDENENVEELKKILEEKLNNIQERAVKELNQTNN